MLSRTLGGDSRFSALQSPGLIFLLCPESFPLVHEMLNWSICFYTCEYDGEWSWTGGPVGLNRQGRDLEDKEEKPLLSLNRQEFSHSMEQPLQSAKEERPASCCPWLQRALHWGPLVSVKRFYTQEMLFLEMKVRPRNSQMGGRTVIGACAWHCTEHLGSELSTVE